MGWTEATRAPRFRSGASSSLVSAPLEWKTNLAFPVLRRSPARGQLRQSHHPGTVSQTISLSSGWLSKHTTCALIRFANARHAAIPRTRWLDQRGTSPDSRRQQRQRQSGAKVSRPDNADRLDADERQGFLGHGGQNSRCTLRMRCAPPALYWFSCQPRSDPLNASLAKQIREEALKVIVVEGRLQRQGIQRHLRQSQRAERHYGHARRHSALRIGRDSGRSTKPADEPRVLLERQYRYAAQSYLWELPAGRIDPGESALAGAKRELIEETGYRAKQVEAGFESSMPVPVFWTRP